MLIVIGSADRYVGPNLARIVTECGLRSIRTNKVERIVEEMKQPNRTVIIDLNWKDIQQSGLLRQIVNIGRISGNICCCICPNQEEDLKKLAKTSRAQKVFLRYDLETTFRGFLEEL
jgi:hypothetical protein